MPNLSFLKRKLFFLFETTFLLNHSFRFLESFRRSNLEFIIKLRCQVHADCQHFAHLQIIIDLRLVCVFSMDSELILYRLVILIIGATLVDVDMLLDCQLVLPFIEANMTN
jgi:hypothetical protein